MAWRKSSQAARIAMGSSTVALSQRHHPGGETLQSFDAFSDGGAFEVEDQFVCTDRREAADVTCDIVARAGKASAGVIQRRLVRDG
jgi:hypothetical protein